MWFAVKTKSGEEDITKDLLVSKLSLVRDAFVPKQSRTEKNTAGKQYFHISPLISGILFVDFRIDADAPRKQGESLSDTIWQKLKQNVTPRGYFHYREAQTGEFRQIAGAHLLTGDPRTSTPEKFICDSRIPDADMSVFMSLLNDNVLEAEDVQLVSKSFQTMAHANDIVRVMTGPWAGIEGVVVQKSRAVGGVSRKDRHLEVRFGNTYCISLSNVRRYELAIVRKAQVGDKARMYHLWHEADYLTGMLQRSELHRDDAAQTLRQVVTTVIRKQGTSMDEVLHTVNSITDNDGDVRRLFTFATSLPSDKYRTTEQTVAEYIPSYPIRAFLTPSSEEEACAGIQTIQHQDFKELVIPVNLRSLFIEGYRVKDNLFGADEPVLPSADCSYNAHVAVITEGEDARKAIVSWGTFYDAYAAQTPEQREGFLQDLIQKGYLKAYTLLTTGHPLGNPDSPKISFRQIAGIGGFSLVIRGSQQDAARALIDAVAPVAVEFCQKERLRLWRQHVQQTVLIEKA